MENLLANLNILSRIILPGLSIIFITSALFFYTKEKKYCYDTNGWLDIKKYPIPEDIGDFFATDGKEVKHFYTPRWGPHGEVLFSDYSKKSYVKYWLPMPSIPSKIVMMKAD